MRKASQMAKLHVENYGFDRVIRELESGKLSKGLSKDMTRIPYAHTKQEKELKDAKSDQRRDGC